MDHTAVVFFQLQCFITLFHKASQSEAVIKEHNVETFTVFLLFFLYDCLTSLSNGIISSDKYLWYAEIPHSTIKLSKRSSIKLFNGLYFSSRSLSQNHLSQPIQQFSNIFFDESITLVKSILVPATIHAISSGPISPLSSLNLIQNKKHSPNSFNSSLV